MADKQIIAALVQKKSALQAKGVQHLALFGSQTRSDAREDSDLDVLIDVDPALPKFSLLDLASVANFLTDITGIDTVAIDRRMLAKDPQFAKRIADGIVEVF